MLELVVLAKLTAVVNNHDYRRLACQLDSGSQTARGDNFIFGRHVILVCA